MASFATPAPGHAEASDVTVIKGLGYDDHLERVFQRGGPAAVVDELRTMLKDPEAQRYYRNLAASGQVKFMDIRIHKNEKASVDWMNHRFKRMGLPNLVMRPEFDNALPDLTVINEDKIRASKWARFLIGPGAALGAFAMTFPYGSADSLSHALYLSLPAAGVSVMTIIIEFAFATPKINDRVWKPLWTMGGQTGGSLINMGVQFALGMLLYGANVGAAHLPTLFGFDAVPTAAPDLMNAIWLAVPNAITYHISKGQYQNVLAMEEQRGTITSSQRYILETTGSVYVGGARVVSWMLPPEASAFFYLAQASFFLLKTFPQFLQTGPATWLEDRRIRRDLRPDLGPTRVELCAEALSRLNLVNLPNLAR